MILIDTIRSSMIAQIGYDEASLTLVIKFTNGDMYEYFNVPKETFDALANADSEGKYFIANIKGKFEYKKVVQ